MKKLTLSFFLFIVSINAFSQNVEVIKFDALKSLLESRTGQISIINFWATWCAPCVKELPLFEKVNAENPSIGIILINLDFADKIEKVNAFLIKKGIKCRVLLLDELDYNKWIDEVDKNWSGAIPATLIVNSVNQKRKFIEKELHEGDLEKLIMEVL